MSVIMDAGTIGAPFAWGLVIVRDGETANNLNIGAAAALYKPEGDLLAWGHGTCNALIGGSGDPVHYNDKTKTMRKMMAGDTLNFLVAGEATNTMEIRGAVQFMCLF